MIKYVIATFICFFITGCQSSSTIMSIKYSEKKYQMRVPTYQDFNSSIYEPVPHQIISLKSKVISTKRPFFDSMSVAQEKTRTTFKILEGNKIPHNDNIRILKLLHFTYIVNPPLKKNDEVLLLFDKNGCFIDVEKTNIEHGETMSLN